MKNNILFLFFFLLCAVVTARQNNAPVLIQGELMKDNISSVSLFEVVDGQKEVFATTKLNAGKQFAFAVPGVTPGYYYIGADKNRSATRIYLQPGIQLRIVLTDTGHYISTGSPENRVLYQWEKMRGLLKAMSSPFGNDNLLYKRRADTATYTDFFLLLQHMTAKAAQFKTTIRTPNSSFNAFMQFTVDMDMEAMALSYLLTPHTKHATREEYPAYYASILQPKKFPTAGIFRLGEGNALLNNYVTFNLLMGNKPPEKGEFLQWGASLIGNDTLKGALVIGDISRRKSFDDVLQIMDTWKTYILTDAQKKAGADHLKSVSTFKKGETGYNFNFADINDKKVSLKDLSGKLVVIDVWATWCGPCKVEIPHLKKLSEEMKEKEVVFVSISVDEQRDKEKWKKFVADEQLEGVQLHDPAGSAILGFYDIKGIPRFMVFDKQGKIITIDAPRPSSPQLKNLIEKNL